MLSVIGTLFLAPVAIAFTVAGTKDADQDTLPQGTSDVKIRATIVGTDASASGDVAIATQEITMTNGGADNGRNVHATGNANLDSHKIRAGWSPEASDSGGAWQGDWSVVMTKAAGGESVVRNGSTFYGNYNIELVKITCKLNGFTVSTHEGDAIPNRTHHEQLVGLDRMPHGAMPTGGWPGPDTPGWITSGPPPAVLVIESRRHTIHSSGTTRMPIMCCMPLARPVATGKCSGSRQYPPLSPSAWRSQHSNPRSVAPGLEMT
jgi:hypothetical protein